LHGTGALGSSVDVRYAVPKWVRIALERANQQVRLNAYDWCVKRSRTT
jgi:hypothetical protein